MNITDASLTLSIANKDSVASRKPRPELRVRTTKQMMGIFRMVHSLKKELLDGSASRGNSYVNCLFMKTITDLNVKPKLDPAYMIYTIMTGHCAEVELYLDWVEARY